MKALILGDGLLGTELVNQTNWHYVSRKKDKLDITSHDMVKNILSGYDVVINCIANTDSYSQDKKKHFDVNYRFPVLLADICNAHNLKLVHISTEFVYANNKNVPTEEDLPRPDNTWYAYAKLLADEYIQLKCSDFLICRETHKPKPFVYPSVWNVKTTGDTVDKMADLIIKLVVKDAKGIFNVGTGEKKLIDLCQEGIGVEVEAPSHVPQDTRMNLDKLKRFLSQDH